MRKGRRCSSAEELRIDIIEKIKFILHSCRIYVVGLHREQAINRLMRTGMGLSKLQWNDEITVSFLCSYSDFKKVRSFLGKKYQVYCEDEKGAFCILRNIRRRTGLVVGCIAVVLLLLLQQNFITEIEIHGAVKTEEAELRHSLKELGIYEGAFLKAVDREQLQAGIQAAFPEIRWMNVIRQGSHVEVEVLEGNLNEEAVVEGIFDLVAAKSGYVTNIIAKEGYPFVQEGDYVEAGQVLLSAYYPVNNSTYDTERDGIYRLASAEGSVEAEVIYRLQAKFSAEKYTEKEQKKLVESSIRKYIRENLPEIVKINKKDLKFRTEENIIVCDIALQVTENIAIKKETEFAEDRSRDKGTTEGNENHAG